MEKNNEFDMYEFMEKPYTRYDSMYKILENYLPILEGDFSTANLVNKMTELNAPSIRRKSIDSLYHDVFENLCERLRKTLEEKQMSQDPSINDEINRLYYDLQSASPDKRYTNIRGYLNYAKANIDNTETKKLRDTIVNAATKYLNKNEELSLRHGVLNVVYFIKINDILKKKYPGYERSLGEYPEWSVMEFIKNTLTNKKTLEKYDEFYKEFSKEIDRVKKQKVIELKCKSKRKDFVNTSILQGMNDEDSQIVSKSGIIDTIFKQRKKLSNPKKGHISWKIAPYKKPKLLLNTTADYTNSKDGLENQKVIAVSYGKFYYENPPLSNSLTPSDLIGITRIGNDGAHTYFVIAPLGKINLKETPEINEEENRYQISINGKKVSMVDSKSGKKYYTAFESTDFDGKQKDFYSKVFLSDEYLSKAIDENFRCIGSVKQNKEGNDVISAEDVSVADLEAAKYARVFPGKVGRTDYSSLDEYCDFYLQQKHLRIVGDIVNGTYTMDRSNISQKRSNNSPLDRSKKADTKVEERKIIKFPTNR